MKFQIGQVKIRVGFPAVSSGKSFELELDAPLGNDRIHVYVDYLELAVEKLRVNMIIAKGDDNHEKEGT